MKPDSLKTARRAAEAVAAAGGRAYLVGGCVRDELLKRPCKDIDIEVHGLSAEQLVEQLGALGRVKKMGKSFTVYSLSGMDIALPRAGRNRSTPAPFIGEREAARRRDFTVNALMKDVLTGELLDFFGGQKDLERGVLRHVDDETFGEDPLRVLRAAQLAARLHAKLAPETAALCRTLDLSQLPRERVWGEVEKALVKADRPSRFFDVLEEVNARSFWFPEIEAADEAALRRMLDEAAACREAVKRPLVLMLAALCRTLSEADGARFLNRLTNAHRQNAEALKQAKLANALTRAFQQQADGTQTNRIFDASPDPEALAVLALCGEADKAPMRAFFQDRLKACRRTMDRPGVTGLDLEAAGLAPDAQFSRWMAYAHDLHLAGIGREEALQRTLAYARKQRDDL